MPLVAQTLIDFLQIAAWETSPTRELCLLIGLVTLAGGIILMFRHQSHFRTIQETTRDPRVLDFENRKFRRRSLSSALIAALGVMLGTLYWADHPKSFAMLTVLILGLLLGILGLAIIDLMSVGLNQLAEKDDSQRQKLVDEVIRRRKEKEDGERAIEQEEESLQD